MLLSAAALVVPFASLSIALGGAAPDATVAPLSWLFGALAVGVALPFFVLAMSPTLLQRAASSAAPDRDP